MSDLSGDARFLKYHYTSDESLLDKDTLKNQSFNKLQTCVSGLFMFPFGLQFAQLYFINIPEKAALYQKIKFLKVLTVVGAIGVGYYELHKFDKYWTFLNRFYPEPTQLQKGLYRDAMLFKEKQYQPVPFEEKTKIDATTTQIYEQMYRLPPQRYVDPDDDFNAATIKPHY
eukprot:403362425